MVRIGIPGTRLHGQLSERDNDSLSHPTLYMTKDAFIHAINGTEKYTINTHNGYRIDADLEDAYTEFQLPDDFDTLVSIELVFIALADIANMVLGIYERHSAEGENTVVTAGNTTMTRTVSQNFLYAEDISAAFAGLAAGDYVTVRAQRPTAGNANCVVLGIRLKWR